MQQPGVAEEKPSLHGRAAMVVCLTAMAICGCSQDDAIRLLEGQSSLRLVDVMTVADVSSPLLEVEPIESIAAIAGIEPTNTVEGRFKANQSQGCGLEMGGDGGIEVVCGGEAIDAVWGVPVAANSYARVKLSVLTDDAECFEVSVQNGKQEEIFLSLDPRRPDEWQSLSTTVLASAVVGLGPKVRVRSQPGRVGCDIRVADVGGEEFELEPEQELGLLKAQAVPPGADPVSGLVKLGVMLPTANMNRVMAPFDDNYTITEAILAPAPTEISYRIRVPERSRLLFSYGAHRGSQIGDAAGFEVRAKRRWRDAEIIWTDVVTVDQEYWHWHEAEIDLDRYSGATISLILRTFAPNDGRAYAVWGAPTLDVSRKPTDPPNIVVIGVDTLRADRLSCYGFPGDVSPNIDALAADGARFSEAYAQSNWTRPSFASIFTGMTVEAHGMVGLLDELAPSVTTVAEVLRGSGWSTHAIAYKPALAGRGFEQGFETYFNIPRVVHSAQENLSKAIAFLNRNRHRRFFLFLHFNDPHLPYTHPEPFFGAESEADIEHFAMTRPVWIEADLHNCSRCGTPEAREPRFERMGRRMYVEEIQYLDDRIGALVEELKVRDLYEDSIIVLVSDHGEALWDHYGQFGHGGKNHHDELIKVPLIIKPHRGWGGDAGAVVDTQVRAFDLMPTVLELAGLDLSGLDVEAVSLASMLREPEAERAARIVVSTNEYASAVRIGPWKFVRPLLPHGGSEQLFDLEADPGEHVDVAGRNPDVARELRHAASEHILLRHGGVFVLVVSGEGDHSVRIRWDREAELVPTGHLGLPLTTAGGGAGLRFRSSDFVFSGSVMADPLAVLAGFLVPGGAALDVAVDGGPEVRVGQFPVYRAGDLERVVDLGEPGVFVFASPARSHRSLERAVGGETRVDAQQLDALRALGYVGD